METIAIATLLEYGIQGLVAIALLLAWYERREMRRDQLELIRLLLHVHPEAKEVLNGRLRKIAALVPETKKDDTTQS